MPDTELLRTAESALKKLGFSRVPPVHREASLEPTFWVQESGVPRRTFPVFVGARQDAAPSDGIERWLVGARRVRSPARRAIFVVPSDRAAEEAWDRLAGAGGPTLDSEVSVLVVPSDERTGTAPHFHLRLAEPRELLRLATGVVVGLFRRAQAADEPGQVDFEEMLQLLRQRFGVDVQRSLGVRSDEDALFLLYQLAQRDSYAPGDPGSNLHLLVLKPTGPAARLPWFAG
jgi:hypothetical protein